MPSSPQELLIDRVDAQDQVIGVIARNDVFAEHANFRVAHVLVFNRAEELLLQRLSPSRERNPGLWGSSVAAYVHSGETYEATARRALSEELGVETDSLVSVGKDVMTDQGCLKHMGLFVARSEGPFSPDAGQIAELRVLPVPEVERWLEKEPEQFTPTFREVFACFCAPGDRIPRPTSDT